MIMREIKRIVNYKSKKLGKRVILFPESNDDRILKAVEILKNSGVIEPVLLGDIKEIRRYARKYKVDVKDVRVIEHKITNDFVEELYKLRKHKGWSKQKCRAMLKKPMYYAVMLLHFNVVDGVVAGAVHTTADTLRPAFQIIKTKDNWRASSSFVLVKKNHRPLFFADCGVIIKPNEKELAQIAIATGDLAKEFGIKPKIAMLSFSTHGSAKHEEVDRIRKATMIARRLSEKLKRDYIIDGELQFDTAFSSEVAKRKCKDCIIKGDANVFIFPDLNTGNISYKIVQRIGHYEAIGPILQKLKKPVNDLSRGCNVKEVVDLAYITALQSFYADK